MQNSTLPSRDLILVGAGHTNLHIVRMWRMRPIPDVRLTLVSPFGKATYSGMLPGTLAGLYAPEEMEIDLHRFAAACGIRLVVAAAVGLDPRQRQLHLADRPPLRFDVASVGIGSVPAGGDVWGKHDAVLSIKPMATFRDRLEARLRAAGEGPLRVAVVGAGAGGIEIAFCLHAHLRRRGRTATMTLVDAGAEVLSGYLPGTVRRVRAELERRGIAVRNGVRAVDHADGRLRLDDGSTVEADLVIWAAGAAPPPVLEHFDLPHAPDGFLAVRPTLQTTGEFPVFVVGDTASLVEHPLPRAGVYAVREGPVLWDNLRRWFAGRPLRAYEPQHGFLSLLALGDGTAVGQWKGLSARGRWVWRWKDHIDRKFMRMYQDYRPTAMAPAPATAGPPAMRCRGCGGKVGANVLAAALARLDVPTGPPARQGLDQPDDAALLDPRAGLDVLSVDFFHAFLDDPYLVGRVAALNALSDLWAMNADPAGAMAMVTIPQGPPRQQVETLYQLLAGGLRELTAAGATLLGGHTLEGADLSVGFTVLGKLDDRPAWTKGKLQAGDRLVLTRPLGTGVLLAAHGEARCEAPWMDALLAQMLKGNGDAARVGRELGVRTATDVTGFGLAGHLLEMLDAGHVRARLTLSALPLLDGFAELTAAGVRSTLYPANRTNEERLLIGPAPRESAAFHALFDPQTSGGLLLAVSPAGVEELLRRLRDTGHPHAAVVGEVLPPGEGPPLEIEN